MPLIVLLLGLSLSCLNPNESSVQVQTFIQKSHVNMSSDERELIDWGDLPLSFSADQVFPNDGWALYVLGKEVWVINKLYAHTRTLKLYSYTSTHNFSSLHYQFYGCKCTKGSDEKCSSMVMDELGILTCRKMAFMGAGVPK